MISSWKRLKAALRAAKKREDLAGMELAVPGHFRCPISLDLMKDPVTLSTGITFDRENIEKWIEAGNVTCPVTKKVLRNLDPIPNHAIRRIIQDWCVENTTYGVERIPTPRIPITSHEVSEILAEIEGAVQRQNYRYCSELVLKLKASAKESERNRRCIAVNGAGRVLSKAFEELSKWDSVHDHVSLFDEILSALSMTLSSLDDEGKNSLSKTQSLHAIVWFLRFGSLSLKRNASLVLKTVLSSNQKKAEDLVRIDGALDALVKLIKEPICPTATKASLVSVFFTIQQSESLPDKDVVLTRFLEMGLLEIVLEVLVDSDRSTTEKTLGVLERICNHVDGRRMACENALTIPISVKKLLRISDLSTEFAVSILWKLAKSEQNAEGRLTIEALHLGAFQKLLLLLQVGCKGSTKEQATELLKLMNLHRKNGECNNDSLDFKNLKNPF